MGGGEVHQSLASVVDAARQNELSGHLRASSENYREASELVLGIAKSREISDDERFCLELQSSEFLAKAQELMSASSQSNVARAVPQTEIKKEDLETPEEVDTATYQNRMSDQTGAIVAGASSGLVLGSLIGMPLIGSATGGMFGGVAASRNDEYGERARRIGNKTASLYERARGVNETYNVSGNIKAGAASALYLAKEFDAKHNVVGKVATASSSAWKKVTELDERYKVSEKAKDTVKATAERAMKYGEDQRTPVAQTTEAGLGGTNRSS